MHLVGFLQPRITMHGTTNIKLPSYIVKAYFNIILQSTPQHSK